MKLNKDCIRDLLLYLEENLTINNSIAVNNIKINNYTSDELLYTADKLYEAKFLNCYRRVYDAQDLLITVDSITYEGHQFLDNIRDDNVWENTKNVLSKFKSTSISFIADVSSQIIANIISKQLGLN